MAGFTDYGTHGTLETPGGTMLLRPDQYAAFGVAPPPVVDDLPPPPSVAPPQGQPVVPAVTFEPPQPGAMPAQPTAQPTAQPAPAPADAGEALAAPAPDGAPIAPGPAPAVAAAEPPPDLPPAPDLSKTTYGDVFNEQRAAVAQGAQAESALLAAQQENNVGKAQALAQRNAAVEAERARFAAEEARQQAEINATMQRHSAAVKAFADAKVDRRNYRVSSMQWLGVALSGLGSALRGQGDKNPALDLLERQIQQYVDDEYKKKDALGQDAAMVKDQLDVLRGAASATQARKGLAVAGIMERHLREAEAAAPLMENREAAANILRTVAQGRERIAGLLGQSVAAQHAENQQAAARAQQERDSRRQAGLGYARLREDARQFDAQLEFNREQKAAAVAAAQTEAEREAAKREVADLKTATVGAGGIPTLGAYRAKNEKLGDTVAEMHAAVRNVDALMAEAIRLRESYPTFAKLKASPEYQKLQANISAAGIAWAKSNHMGAWDNGTATAVLGAQGGDPMRAGYLADTIGRYLQGDARVGLDQFRKNTIENFNKYASSVRDPRGGEFVPIEPLKTEFKAPLKNEDDERVQRLISSKTPQAIRDAAAPSKVAAGLGYVASALDTPGERYSTTAEIAADNFANDVSADASGRLAKDQQAGLDLYAARLARGDAAEASRARKDLVAIATSSRADKALQSAAIDVLVRAGDEAGLADVDAALTAGATSTREQRARRAPIAMSRAIQGAPSSIAEVATLMTESEPARKRGLAAIGSILMGARPMGWARDVTPQDKVKAQELLRAHQEFERRRIR